MSANQSSNRIKTPIKRTLKMRLFGVVPASFTWAIILLLAHACYQWYTTSYALSYQHLSQTIDRQLTFLDGFNQFGLYGLYDKAHQRTQDLTHDIRNSAHYQEWHEMDLSKNGFVQMITKSMPFLSQWAQSVVGFFKLTGLVLWLIVLKFCESIFFLPSVLLCAFLGFFDGWVVKRNIRKAEFDHESTFRFHKFIHYLPTTLMILLTIHLVFPYEIAPILMCFLLMVLSFYYASYLAERFKQRV